MESVCRYGLPIVVLVFNNGGIYGGDRRGDALRSAAAKGAKAGGFGFDPIPTDFVRNARCGRCSSGCALVSPALSSCCKPGKIQQQCRRQPVQSSAVGPMPTSLQDARSSLSFSRPLQSVKVVMQKADAGVLAASSVWQVDHHCVGPTGMTR